jgi:hypothetical protein
MSNIKRISIQGDLPFTCAEHHGMQSVMAQLSGPTIGLAFRWGGESKSVPNEHGGKTAMYRFAIHGEEAVNRSWIESTLQSIVDCGGSIREVEVKDIEADEVYKMTIPKRRVGHFHYTVEVRVESHRSLPLDKDLANILIGDYMKDVVKAGTCHQPNPPLQIKSAVVDHQKWSVRPA